MEKRRMMVVIKERNTKVTVAQRNNLLLVIKIGMTWWYTQSRAALQI
jgi:hypothetical protein